MLQQSGEYRRIRNGLAALLSAVVIFLSVAFGVRAADDLLLTPAEKNENTKASILMDVATANGRLVAVGEWGHIVYSDDDHRTWTQANVPVSVTLTAVTFPTANKGWAVGHEGVVLHTKDGGKTWEKQLDGFKINEMMVEQIKVLVQAKTKQLEDVQSRADDTLVEQMSLELEDLDFLFSDTKMTLEEGPTRPLMDVWFENERVGIVIGAFGIIIRTTDGGETWSPLLDSLNNPEGMHLYSITLSGGDLYIVGERGFMAISHDLGQTWERLTSPYEGSFFGVVGKPQGGLVAAFGLRGSLYFSRDRGQNWSISDTGTTASLNGAVFFPDGSLYIAAVDGSILKSSDQAETFTPLSTRFPGSASLSRSKDGALTVVGLKGVMRIDPTNL